MAICHLYNKSDYLIWLFALKDSAVLLYHHYDVIKWKHFPCYWPFVRGIHLSPMNSPHSGGWDVTKIELARFVCPNWVRGEYCIIRDQIIKKIIGFKFFDPFNPLFRPNPRWPPTVKRKWHIFGVHGPILTILVSIVGFSGCLSWLNLFSKWLYIMVIVKRSFSRSNLQKISVLKACRCLIQYLNGLIANYIMLTTSFS